ncbi:MAG TPA: amidohydrolase family protein [Terriglobales bacterium]|nr:amidohydrolase family protein [Terriglobales bacterium]
MLRPIAILASVLVAASLAAQQSPSAPQPVTLIKAARILDVKAGTYLARGALLIEGEKIKEVGPLAELEKRTPKDAQVIDLGSATVLPGLIDCHAHLLISTEPTLGPGANIVLAVTELRPAERALVGARNAREALEAGVTSARIVGHSGVDADAALRDAINAGWLPGPRLQAAARKITPPGGQAVSVQAAVSDAVLAQEFLPISGVDEARRAVRQALYDGADLVKVVMDAGKRFMTPEEIKAVVEEAHRSRIKVAAHATTVTGIQAAIDAGVDSIEHGDEATDEQLRAMAAKGIFLVPTLRTEALFRQLYESSIVFTPQQRDGFEGFLKRWNEQSRAKMERAGKAGVKIASGTDMWHDFPGKTRGQATVLALESPAAFGVSPLDTIRSATLNAAELMGWSDRAGGLEAGKFADLIAVPGDPLADITQLERVHFVMKGGKVVRNEIGK